MKSIRLMSSVLLAIGLTACAAGSGGSGEASGVHWTVGQVGGGLGSPGTAAVVVLGDTVVLDKVNDASFSSLKTLHVNRFALSRANYLQLTPGQHRLSVLYRKNGMETRTPADLSVNVVAGAVYHLVAEEPKDAVYRIRFNFIPVAANAPVVAAHFNKLKEANNE